MVAVAALLLHSAESCDDRTEASTKTMTMRIELTSEGGISGRGVGGITIDGTTITAGDGRRECRGELTAQERDALAQRVRDAHPERWKTDEGTGHPDQIRYTLKLSDHTISWHGEDLSTLPADVRALYAALWPIRQRVLGGC